MRFIEIFWRFLILGCISFGGPVAHIAYFQNTFVSKLDWVSQQHYSKLIALSQFLPGPGSSQIGFAIGLHRGGLSGGIAAFLGFTLPSFLLMLIIASGSSSSRWEHLINGPILGMKLIAVVVVADAVITMFKTFCQEWQSVLIAIGTTIAILILPKLHTQISALLISAILGAALKHKHNKVRDEPAHSIKETINWLALTVFILLFMGLPLLANRSLETSLLSEFYRAGSLVFGGGHVVLPLLQHSTSDILNNDQFLIGYAAAQAVPGPMFTLASYLGALMTENRFYGALIATVAIFLPGFLLVLALKESWVTLLKRPMVAGCCWGINAAVVGLLAAAFYQPVLINSVQNTVSLLACVIGLLALRLTKCSLLLLIVIFVSSATVTPLLFH